MKTPSMEIKLAALNEMLENICSIDEPNIENFNELKNKLSVPYIIETTTNKYKLKINIEDKTDFYYIEAYLTHTNGTIPLLEHIEPSGKICWRKNNRFEASIKNVFIAIKKILSIINDITASTNYENILTEFDLYIDKGEINIDKRNLIWIINPKFKKENNILINKNIIYVNFDNEIYKNSIYNENKTEWSKIKKQGILTVEIDLLDFVKDRNLNNILNLNKDKFCNNYFHIVWINYENKYKFPLIIQYISNSFIYYRNCKILNDELMNLKNDFSNLNNNFDAKKWNFVIVGAGSIGSYLIDLLASIKPKSIFVIDGDKFSFENIQGHTLSHLLLDKNGFLKNKTLLLQERIKNKFNYDIHIFNEYLNDKNIKNIFSNKLKLNMTIIINCTGEANITALIFNTLTKYKKNIIYISSLFIDSNFDICKNKDYFFIEQWNVKKMQEFLEQWSNSDLKIDKYLCTTFNTFSLIEIFSLLSTYMKELFIKCK